MLRLAALAAPALLARGAGSHGGAAFRILCLGDSHTYGWGVKRREAWPAQLEALLDPPGAPARFEVLNLGVRAATRRSCSRRCRRIWRATRRTCWSWTTGGNDLVNRTGLVEGQDEGSGGA